MLGIPMISYWIDYYTPLKTSDDAWSHHKKCAIYVSLSYMQTNCSKIVLVWQTFLWKVVLPHRTWIQGCPSQNATGKFASLIDRNSIRDCNFRLNWVSLVDLTKIRCQKCILELQIWDLPMLVMKVDTDMDQRVLHTCIPNIKTLTWFQVNNS